MSALHTRRNPSSAGTSVRETPLYEGPCREDSDAWFPAAKKDQAAPKAICKAECPFVAQCLQAALDVEGEVVAKYRHGVWGGATPDERAAMVVRARVERRPEFVTAAAEKRLAPWFAEVEPMVRRGMSMAAIAKGTRVSGTTVRDRLLRHRRDLWEIATGKVPA